MPIRNGSEIEYGQFSEGVDDSTPIDSPESAGTLSIGDNTDLVTDSLAVKRNGYATLFTISSALYRAAKEHTSSSGTSSVLLYSEASTLNGVSGKWSVWDGATASTLTSGLHDGVRPSVAQFKSQTFVFDGYNDFATNGTTTHRIGIPPPTSAPTFKKNIAGSKNTSGNYVGVYTYYNSQTGAESSPSPASEIVTTGATANKAGIRWNITAGDSSLADTIKFYITVSGGNLYFLDGTTTITATTYDATVVDTGLGRQLEPDNSLLFEKGTIVQAADNRLLVAGFATNPNRIHYSKIGSNGPMPESFQAADFVDCDLNDGDKIVDMGLAGTSIIVVKERSVGRLIKIQASSGGVETSGSTKYVYERISGETTGVTHGLTKTIGNVCLWLGRDNIYGTDGVNIVRFGRRIRRALSRIDFRYAWKFHSYQKTDTQKVIWNVCKQGQTEPNYQIVGHYANFPKIPFTFYTPGPVLATHPGMPAGCMVEATVNGEKQSWFGSNTGNGKVYRFDYGSSDDSLGIYWRLGTPWFAARKLGTLKKAHSCYANIAGGGASPNNVILQELQVNQKETTVYSRSETLPGNVTTWGGSMTWADDDWSDIDWSPIKMHPGRTCYSMRYILSNTYARQPAAIKGLKLVMQGGHTH